MYSRLIRNLINSWVVDLFVSFQSDMPLHYPGGYKYLGPGTKDLTAIPLNSTDAIAREHDLDYAFNNVTDEDVFASDKKAIGKFWTDFKQTGRGAALAGTVGLGAKNILEQHIVGHSMYGKTTAGKKNWAQINKINQAKRARLDVNNMASTSNVDDVPQDVTEPMEMVADQPRAGGDGLGGTNTGGSGGGNMSDIYGGTNQTPNSITLEYNKSYHFTITNRLPEWRRHMVDQHIENQARYNNIHGIPWEMLAMYMSEGEIERLSNYSMATVEEVTCQVYSLGVRLPFYTGQTVSQVANANAQYPVGRFFFDKDFQTSYDDTNVQNVLSKCWGEEWKTLDVTETDWSSNFPNLTASTTSRDINNPVIVHYPRTSGPFSNSQEQWPKDVGIYDYCQIKNGSTSFGLMFNCTHKPKQGIISARSDSRVQGSLYPLNTVDNVEVTPIPGEWANFIAGSNTYTSRESTVFNARNWCMGRSHHGPPYPTAVQVDNSGIFGVGSSKAMSEGMPKLMLGFVNVRNKDDTILEANWDIMVKCFIRIKVVDNAQPGFISRVSVPNPYIMNPLLTWQNENIGNQTLMPSSSIKTSIYGKRTMMRTNTPLRITDEEKSELNRTNEGKAKLKRIKNDLETEIKYLKKLKSDQGHHHHSVQNQRLKILEKALQNFQ